MWDNEEAQQDSQAKHPDERSPSAIAAVPVVAGGSDQWDKNQAKDRSYPWKRERGGVRGTDLEDTGLYAL